MVGKASVFGVAYPIGGFGPGVNEIVESGAFRRTLGTGPDLQLLVSHGAGGSGLPIAGTGDGSLEVTEDHEGLAVRAELDETDTEAASVLAKLRRGKLAMSFAFRVPKGGDEWDESYTLRRLREVSLTDAEVSLVARGANPAASAELRGEALTVEQRRTRAERAGRQWTRTAPVFVAGELCGECRGLGCETCLRLRSELDNFSVWLRSREAAASYRTGAVPPERDPIARARQRTRELQERWAEHEAHRAEWESG